MKHSIKDEQSITPPSSGFETVSQCERFIQNYSFQPGEKYFDLYVSFGKEIDAESMIEAKKKFKSRGWNI